MEPLLALQDILLRSLPTFALVWILYLYVAKFFYRPLQETLKKRYDATEGLRKSAAERIAAAESRANEYQQALRNGRAEMYRQQEQERQRALERRNELLKQARKRAEERIVEARQQLQGEVAEAKQLLARESEQMAEWITRAILQPTAESSAQQTALTEGRS